MTDRERDEAERIALAVLARAQEAIGRPEALQGVGRDRTGGPHFGQAWLRASGEAFREAYRDRTDVHVFAKGLGPVAGLDGTSVWPGRAWRRREYLFDVSVLEVEPGSGAFRTDRAVPVVRRGLWQVESEIARDTADVAEDLGSSSWGGPAVPS